MLIQTTSCITKVFLVEIWSSVNGSRGEVNPKMWTILCCVIDSMYWGKWSLLNSTAKVCNCIWHLSVFAGRCWLGCWWGQRVKNWYVCLSGILYYFYKWTHNVTLDVSFIFRFFLSNTVHTLLFTGFIYKKVNFFSSKYWFLVYLLNTFHISVFFMWQVSNRCTGWYGQIKGSIHVLLLIGKLSPCSGPL